jgi:hypothetical protein
MKISYCLIASLFIGGSIMTMQKCGDCAPYKGYLDGMTPEQRELYMKIKNERMRIYYIGLVVGTILAFTYIYANRNKTNDGLFKHVCTFVAIAMGTQYLVYQLHPKTHWMLRSLNKKEQIDGWLEVYKDMKYKYHLGFLLGSIGYTLLSYGFIAISK